MRVVCYYLRISRNRNVVFLNKLKDAPSVVDGDKMLDKNGIYYRVWEVDLCGAFQKIGHWNQLNVCCERDYNVGMSMGDVTCNGHINV